MSMIRTPALYTATPLHGRIPEAGTAFSYALRRNGGQALITGIPDLTKTVTGVVSDSEYTDPRLYQYPNDNGNTNKVQWVAAEDEDEGSALNRVLTLRGMSVGEQIIVATDLAYEEQAGTNGTLWSWGANGAKSLIGFAISVGEVPQFHFRANTASGGSLGSQAMTSVGVSTFADFKAQGRFACVMSIVPVSATTVDVEMRIGNGTLEGRYTASAIDVTQAGSGTNPGYINGTSMATFVGLSIGSLGAAGANVSYWGRGGANVGRQDVLHGWRGTYNASRTAAVLEDMVATNVLDFPPALAT